MAETSGSDQDPFTNLDFIQVFDRNQPEVSDADRALAAERFRNLGNELFLRYADFVQPWPEFPDRLALSLELPHKMGHWAITVEIDREADTDEEKPKNLVEDAFPMIDAPIAVSLRSISKGLHTQEAVAYYEDPNGVVRRQDMRDRWMQDQEPSDEEIGQDIAEKIGNALFRELDQGAGYLDFEREIGINHQPVAPSEIEGLRAMLTSPRIRPIAQ